MSFNKRKLSQLSPSDLEVFVRDLESRRPLGYYVALSKRYPGWIFICEDPKQLIHGNRGFYGHHGGEGRILYFHPSEFVSLEDLLFKLKFSEATSFDEAWEVRRLEEKS